MRRERCVYGLSDIDGVLVLSSHRRLRYRESMTRILASTAGEKVVECLSYGNDDNHLP